MSWIDSHCHLQSFQKKGDLNKVLERSTEAGVKKLIAIGTSPEDWQIYRDLAFAQEGQNRIYHTIGLHPCYVKDDWDEILEVMQTFLNDKCRPVALGEIGLDYFRLPKNKTLRENVILAQKDALRKQLTYAKSLNLPVVVHSRESFEDCILIIEKSGISWAQVVFHCFSGGENEIKILNEKGARASFTGMITYPQNKYLLNAASKQPIDLLMLETDSPYLSPVPYRGQINEPARIPEIGDFISKSFGICIDELSEVTSQATESFFGL
ncbi:MAG: TatD family hydrolase [Verrucomicrobiota bacterium]|nr:TatD family hydrolase [Verrucomicrobiota bacterium]